MSVIYRLANWDLAFRMENPTNIRTWKPKVGGILTIFCGALEVWGSLVGIGEAWSPRGIYMGVALYTVGLIAIVGGILALRRRVWWLALTGAICALLDSVFVPGLLTMVPPLPPGAMYAPGWIWVVMGMPVLILGILAVTWIASSRQEFT